MKFKIGDKVRIISGDSEHKKPYIGKECIIRYINPNGEHVYSETHYSVGEKYVFKESELKLVNELPIPPVHLNCLYSRSNFEWDIAPKIKRVIFNDPATIIMWTDGTKSVVKCQNGEPFDAEKGFALAYLKKLLGNKNEFNKEIHKWVTDNVGEITTE